MSPDAQVSIIWVPVNWAVLGLVVIAIFACLMWPRRKDRQ